VSRRALAFIGIAIVALFAIVLVSVRPARSESDLIPTYSSTDAGPGGVLALRRWLAGVGFETRSLQGVRFEVPVDVDVTFAIGPFEAWSPEDAQVLYRWVEHGGVAIVASDRSIFDEALFAAFGVALEGRPAAPIGGEISPALDAPPFRDLSTGTARALRLDAAAAVLVGDAERAIVAERRIGSGRVYLSSAPDMLANKNIGAAQNDRLVLNMLQGARPGSVVAFDEFHHGAHTEPTLFGLFTETAPGRAFLFVGAAVFLYIALRGRRFGAALPLQERPPRSSLDYVRSFAGLLRRAGARELAGDRLGRVYRRRLARVGGVRATASDDEVAAALARSDPSRASLTRELLARLERPVSDNDLLATVERANRVVEEVERR
jgi:hypothetical protein